MDGWDVAEDGRSISRRFKFADFPRAFGFMSAAAVKAESMNHHPNWSNVYSTVDVTLWSHDAGGVTERDLALARYMDEVAG